MNRLVIFILFSTFIACLHALYNDDSSQFYDVGKARFKQSLEKGSIYLGPSSDLKKPIYCKPSTPDEKVCKFQDDEEIWHQGICKRVSTGYICLANGKIDLIAKDCRV